MVGVVGSNQSCLPNKSRTAGGTRKAIRKGRLFRCAPKRPLGPCSPGLALHRIAAIDSGAVFSDPSASRMIQATRLMTTSSGSRIGGLLHASLFPCSDSVSCSPAVSRPSSGTISCVLRRKPRDGQRLECRRFASADRFHQRFRRADFLSPGRLHLRLPGGRAGSRPLRGWAAGGQRDSRRCRRALGNRRFPLRLRRTLRYCRVQGIAGPAFFPTDLKRTLKSCRNFPFPCPSTRVAGAT